MKSIPYGAFVDPGEMRALLAEQYHSDKTCPVTTGIFSRIILEAFFEEYQSGYDLESITPFWRIVNPHSKLDGKLTCDLDFIAKRQTYEKIELIRK